MSIQVVMIYDDEGAPYYQYEYTTLPENLKTISLSVDAYRKKGCQWRIDGQPCKKECAPFIFYCQEHKDIPDIKRYEPITTCRKRK